MYKALLILFTFSTYGADQITSFNNTKAILNNTKYGCMGCHTRWSSYNEDDFIKDGLVIPGSPQTSPLILKLVNSGGTMPKNKNVSLTDDEFKLMQNWIKSLTSKNLAETSSKYDHSSNNQVKLFYKCYGHITRDIPDVDSEIFKNVQSGKISAVDACMGLIDKSLLDSSGMLPKLENGDVDPIARKILKTFHGLHRTWFQSDNFSLSIDTGESFAGTQQVYYPGEMAIHFTRALFQPNILFKETVTSDKTFEFKRSNGTNYHYGVSRGGKAVDLSTDANKFNYFSFTYDSVSKKYTYSDALFITPRLIQKGEPEGIIEMVEDFFPRTYFDRSPDADARVEYKKSTGGGFIGTVPFLLLNNGRNRSQKFDGGINQYRRWGKEFFKSALCRDIPVVRSRDAQVFVDMNSSLPFKKGVSCMQCHSSADRVSQIHRNRMITTTSVSGGLSVALLKTFNVTMPEEQGYPSEADADFYQRPPTGTFYFRDFNGNLHDEKVHGAQELGETLSNLDDYYACTVSRYYHFFTGVNVPLFDPGDFSSPKLNSKENTQKDIIIKLGQELKKNQSLKQLIKNIISSAEYQNN